MMGTKITFLPDESKQRTAFLTAGHQVTQLIQLPQRPFAGPPIFADAPAHKKMIKPLPFALLWLSPWPGAPIHLITQKFRCYATC